MLQASSRAAYLIAKSEKAHSIGEDLIKSCLVEVAEIISGNEVATKPNRISISDNTVKRRIKDMSSDMLAQIVRGIKNSAFPIASQLDESIAIARVC